MIRASSLSGDTLITCHYPVVQLPSWQLPVQALCSAAERPGRLCARGVTRAVSLPEQDTLHRGPALACNRQRASSGSLKEERAEEEAVSDSSGRYDSSSSLEDALQRAGSGRTKECPAARGGLRSRNPFLPSADLEEDEEDEDSDGDNLHKYREDSSFVLHGNFNWALRNVPRNPKVPIADAGGVRGGEPSVLDVESDRESLSNQPNSLDPPSTEFQILDVRESGGCGQDPARRKSNMPCFTFGQPKCPESVNTGHRESVSDSSCNSSDGILVNFCTIYNKSNNPATPHDNLGSPAPRPQPPDEGSVFLNLRPVPRSPGRDPRRGTRTVSPPLEEETKATPSAPRWSPRGLDSNCNLYPLEPASRGPSSPEVSDLTACLQSPVTLTTGTNQKYYKLVTCDPPSQSPSPAWSGLGSRPEGQRRSGLVPPSESFSLGKGKEGHRKDEKEKETQQTDGAGSFPLQSTGGFDCTKRGGYNPPAYTEKPLCETVPTDYVRRCSDAPVRLSRSSTRSNLSQGGRGVSAHPPAILEHCETGAEDEGACSWATPVVRYSKAQRPTSLPIQPFVLLPPGNPKTQHLGTLLDQYISHKSSKPSSSQPVSKCKGEGDRLPTRLQPSPMGNFGPILLEAPSSSDTCSTCTPSPECFSHSRTWSHSSAGNRHTSLCTSQSSINLTHASPQPNAVQLQDNTSPYAGPTQDKNVLNLNSNSPGSLIPPQNQSSLGKVPTCHDLISLTPEQTRATTGTGRESPTPPQTQSTFPPAPPALPGASQTQPGHPLMPLSPNPASEPKDEWRRRPPTPAAEPASFYGGLSAALSTVAPLSSLSSLLSLARSKACPRQGTAGPGEEQSRSRRCDSLMLSDRPPTELCLSPDASYESMSISHLQRRGLLRSVSGAVDLIMAHFGSSRDHEEKMRLGNSSRSPTIVGLVLEHLCPTIQNILEDGLRDHKLDLIIGQRRNHSWSVVEVSSQIGRSSRVLHNLVSKIRQCPQLSSHCMRLRAFIMGLLNLRSLEFWLSNLQSQKDVVAAYYHSWGFLSVSQSRCQPLFQELLLLLQPLSAVPFDLNLLLEPRLLQSGRLISADDQCSPPPPSACYTLLMSSWPQLQAERHAGAGSSSKQTGPVAAPKSTSNGTSRAEVANGGPWSGWQIRQPLPVYGVAEGGRCGRKPRSRRGVGGGGPQEAAGGRETPPPGEQPGPRVRDGSPSRGGLRWARLFGAAGVPSDGTPPASPSPGGAQPRRCRHPSRWLRLDGARLGRLARSAMSAKLGGGGEAEQAFA